MDSQGVSEVNGSRANKTFRGAIKCIENEQEVHWCSSEGVRQPENFYRKSVYKGLIYVCSDSHWPCLFK